MNKKIELLKLAKLRQSTIYEGYNSISDYNDGYDECDYVSPYSKSAHNVAADVFIILQDWASHDNMQEICEVSHELGYSPYVRTNKTLIRLLEDILTLKLEDTYATNLFPFIKKGGTSTYIPAKYMRDAAKQFTLPMIDIIRPKIAIALGRKTFDSLSKVCENKKNTTDESFTYNNTKVFHQPHPAARISNEKKEIGWKEMNNSLIHNK